ncbi:hypothetical protein BJ085DRAFT_2193, partial [Dimargaris cristalligena]
YLCSYEDCDRAFHCQTLLDDHLNTHTGACPYVCTEPGCSRAFNKKQNLKYHLYSHLPYEARPLACDFPHCHSRFYDACSLRKHQRIHTDPQPFKCPQDGCSLAFTKKYQLTRHVSEHTGQLPHGCDFPGCGRSFKYPSYLRKHKLDHEGPDRPPKYPCTQAYCEQGFPKWSELQAHLRADHPPQCSVCQSTFKCKQSLRRHAETVHNTNHSKFPCPWEGCTKLLRSAQTLRNHILCVHEKTKLFVCQFADCEVAWGSKGSLDKHYRE